MNYIDVLQAQRAYFQSGKLRSHAARKNQLLVLQEMVIQHESEIAEALHQDLGKSYYEAYTSEIGFLKQEIKHTLSNLKKWMAPVKVSTPLPLLPAKSAMYSEGRGVNLIISPWNYPFQLLMAPLVGCIAAGNTAILMPSDQADATASLVEKLVQKYFDPQIVAVFNGQGAEIFQMLTNSFRFDHIFFTGSTEVGKVIAKAAAAHLIPVTLELGGKSPAIIHEKADLTKASRRIVWGKYYNCGQTCVSPDYVLIPKHLESEFVNKTICEIEKFFTPDAGSSPDYGKIINEKRLHKLIEYLKDGEVLYGGDFNIEKRYLQPTVLRPRSMDSPIMKEEIFGPILPIVTYDTEAEMLALIHKNPNPLALYVFANPEFARSLMANIAFGGGVINNTIIHLANPDLAFGGIGYSGIGKYHGKFSFDTFSHTKSVMNYPTWMDLPLFYPPYKDKLKWVKKIF